MLNLTALSLDEEMRPLSGLQPALTCGWLAGWLAAAASCSRLLQLLKLTMMKESYLKSFVVEELRVPSVVSLLN